MRNLDTSFNTYVYTSTRLYSLYRDCGIEDLEWGPAQIRQLVLTNFGCKVLNFQILRMSVQGDLTPSRSNNNTNTTAQTLSSQRTRSRGSDDPLTALQKGGLLLRNDDDDKDSMPELLLLTQQVWTNNPCTYCLSILSSIIKQRERHSRITWIALTQRSKPKWKMDSVKSLDLSTSTRRYGILRWMVQIQWICRVGLQLNVLTLPGARTFYFRTAVFAGFAGHWQHPSLTLRELRETSQFARACIRGGTRYHISLLNVTCIVEWHSLW